MLTVELAKDGLKDGRLLRAAFSFAERNRFVSGRFAASGRCHVSFDVPQGHYRQLADEWARMAAEAVDAPVEMCGEGL